MVNLLKGLKTETIEHLANLRSNQDFKKLVEVLRLTQDRNAKLCLTRAKWEAVQQLQWESRAYSIVIQIVEQANKKLSGDKKNGTK